MSPRNDVTPADPSRRERVVLAVVLLMVGLAGGVTGWVLHARTAPDPFGSDSLRPAAGPRAGLQPHDVSMIERRVRDVVREEVRAITDCDGLGAEAALAPAPTEQDPHADEPPAPDPEIESARAEAAELIAEGRRDGVWSFERARKMRRIVRALDAASRIEVAEELFGALNRGEIVMEEDAIGVSPM
jgi:hypothetical protein